MPTEAEIVTAKLIIQREESALQNVEDALAHGQEVHDAASLEADKLKEEEIAAIWERYDAQVQQVTASWDQKRADLNAQMRDIEERLARQREFVAPVKGLPSEVLSEIFTVHVDFGDTPWTLLRVCRLWKAVAFSTPHAWRYIQIVDDRRRFDSGTSFQNCFKNTHFEKALSRTGAAPLNISITLPQYVQDLAASSDRIFALFETITKVLSRCDALELKDAYGFFSQKNRELFATLQFRISSSLKCLRIGVGWASSGIAQKILVASNHENTALRELSLSLGSPGYASLAHSLADHQILLKRLTSFSTTGFIAPKNILAAMRSLTYLSQTSNNLALPDVSNVADLLEEAEFIKTTFVELSTHQFGNLRKLVLRWCIDLMPPGVIKAPVLNVLVIQGGSWLPILVFDCPSLSHLEMEEGPSTKPEARKELNQIWGPARGFVHLKTLKVNMVMSDAVLIAILKKLVALECLSITAQKNAKRVAAPGDTFFNSLLITNTQRLGFLQNLRTLSLQREDMYSEKSDGLLAGLRTGIKRVVRSRQQAAPLCSATLQVIERSRNKGMVVYKEEFVVCEEKQ